MTNISRESKIWFEKFCLGGVSPIDFSNWLKNNIDLESEIGNGMKKALLDSDFNKPGEVHKARNIAWRLCNETSSGLDGDYIIKVLEKMLDCDLPLVEGCQLLGNMTLYDECKLVPLVFEGYSSEYDDLGSLDFYHDRIIRDCRKLLLKLRSLSE